MSGSQTPPGTGTGTGAAGSSSEGDPSMEDILASIRRILSEDEAPAAVGKEGPASPPAQEKDSDGVLVLDPAMMVPEPEQPAPPPAMPASVPATPQLVAPAAAAAAASSVSSLVRTLTAERNMQVHSGGPTIEDLVREELRPLLKTWLDENLPPLVERLVRVEIERVVGRAVT
jgi:cell pole-organizing protein PopZ